MPAEGVVPSNAASRVAWIAGHEDAGLSARGSNDRRMPRMSLTLRPGRFRSGPSTSSASFRDDSA